MNDSNYSPSLVSALKIARGMALQDKHNTFGVSHLSWPCLQKTRA